MSGSQIDLFAAPAPNDGSAPVNIDGSKAPPLRGRQWFRLWESPVDPVRGWMADIRDAQTDVAQLGPYSTEAAARIAARAHIKTAGHNPEEED